jgi:cysteinyl-tRNA synthetase
MYAYIKYHVKRLNDQTKCHPLRLHIPQAEVAQLRDAAQQAAVEAAAEAERSAETARAAQVDSARQQAHAVAAAEAHKAKVAEAVTADAYVAKVEAEVAEAAARGALSEEAAALRMELAAARAATAAAALAGSAIGPGRSSATAKTSGFSGGDEENAPGSNDEDRRLVLKFLATRNPNMLPFQHAAFKSL